MEFHHPDTLGTKLVTNPSANTSFEQSHLPFGTDLAAEGAGSGSTNQKFTSYDRSANTGLDYAINRIYSQGQSRFTQVDPIGMAAASADPQSNNLYTYVQNSPVDFVDPSGLMMIAYCTADYYDGRGNYYIGGCYVYYVPDGGGNRGIGDDIGRGGRGGGGGGHSDPGKPVLPDCPSIPDYPSNANLDGNIGKMRDSLKWATTASPYGPDSGDDPLGRTAGHVTNFANLVKPGGDWDYKKFSNAQHNYEAFGNFHFGAVGAAAGFTEQTLLRAAGFVQKHWGDSPGDGGSIGLIDILTNGGKPPFEDQVRDQENISRGVSYYQHKFVLKDCQ